MSAPPLRALALVHEPDGGPGQVGVRLRQRGIDVDTHVITEDYDHPEIHHPLPPLDGYDLLVPMGSIRTLTDTRPIDAWVHDELEMIVDAHRSGVPILGVCFGGQLIATALGGSVEVAPVGEIGWYEIGDGDEPNPVGPGPWLEWHHDRFLLPPGAVSLARNDVAEQLFRIGTTVGTQFHPEIDVPHMEGWLSTVDDGYVTTHGIDADQLMAETISNEAHNIAQCHVLVDWFLDDVANLGLPPVIADSAAAS